MLGNNFAETEEFYDLFGCPCCGNVYLRFDRDDEIREVVMPQIRFIALDPKDTEFCERCEQQRLSIESLLGEIPVKLFDSLG